MVKTTRMTNEAKNNKKRSTILERRLSRLEGLVKEDECNTRRRTNESESTDSLTEDVRDWLVGACTNFDPEQYGLDASATVRDLLEALEDEDLEPAVEACCDEIESEDTEGVSATLASIATTMIAMLDIVEQKDADDKEEELELDDEDDLDEEDEFEESLRRSRLRRESRIAARRRASKFEKLFSTRRPRRR